MFSKNYIVFLEHIRDAAHYICSVLPVDYDAFMDDQTVRFAIVKNLEIIGEATRHIPADIKFKWKSIEWRQMAGMRNKLTHEYWGVDYLIVWQVASEVIPRILEELVSVIEEEKPK